MSCDRRRSGFQHIQPDWGRREGLRKGKGKRWTHPLHLVALWTIKVSLCREALGGEEGEHTQAD